MHDVDAHSDPARTRQVELVLAGVESLPTLAPIATRLLTLGAAEDVDIEEVTRIIESDPAMASRILGMCRRADKGLGDRIVSVRRAIVMLGIEAVRGAALSVAIYDLIESGREAGEPGLDRRGFWRFSIGVACAAQLIAQAHYDQRVDPDEAFVAGLLHALGKPVLDLVLPRSYAKVIALAERHASDSAPLERQLIGLDHHTAGKRVGEHWNLPEALQEVMWLYGQPPASVPMTDARDLILVVTLARSVCRALHVGWSGDFGIIQSSAALCAQMGLADARGEPLVVPELMSEAIHEALAPRLQVLGIEETTAPRLILESLSAANRALARTNAVLDERARVAATQGRTLETIAAFQARATGVRTTAEVFGEIARSVAHLAGEGFIAVLFQARDGEPWHLQQFSSAGLILRSEVVDPPGRDAASRSLARLTDTTHLSVASMALLPWLADYLGDSADLRALRLFPLNPGGKKAGVAAALLCDRDPADALGTGPHLAALTSSWSAALAAASRQEDVKRLTEHLAQANRTLTETQGRLTEAQSLARLGEMASGAAHEMNNPLTVITGNAQMLTGRLRDPKDRAAAEQIVEAGQDLSGLVSALHLIASPPTARPVECEISRVVAVGTARAAQRLRRQPGVQTEIAVGASRVRVDEALLGEAISELVVNAVQADPKGPVRVSVEPDPLTDELTIRVVDAGKGLSSRALVHAFDAFFSDRVAGRGRGLGLTRARSLVEGMGGRISIANAQEGGAIATITLSNWRRPAGESAPGPGELARPVRASARRAA